MLNSCATDPTRICHPRGTVALRALVMTMIKEGADYRLYQTHYTGNRRRGDGAGRTAACVCSTDRERRKCHALLRKRRGSHPL